MEDKPGWTEALNSAVRAIVTLALAAGFILGFAVLKVISGEVYTAVITGVISYWFAARQGEQSAKAAVQAALSTPPPPPPTPPIVVVAQPNGTTQPPGG